MEDSTVWWPFDDLNAKCLKTDLQYVGLYDSREKFAEEMNFAEKEMDFVEDDRRLVI